MSGKRTRRKRESRREPPSSEQVPTPRKSFRELTLRQRFLAVLVALAASVAVLVVVELGLRIGGYGSDYPLFIPYPGVPGYLYPNPKVATRYGFPPEFAPPKPPLDVFPAVKKPGTIRLFVQGGSTTAGFPYSYGGAFAKMLQQRLIGTYPNHDVQVVNTAITAVNSYTLLDMADEIIAQHPDAVLIYAGHNEYYGVLGVASHDILGRVPALMRVYMAFLRLRLVELLRRIGARIVTHSAKKTPARTLMGELAGSESIDYGSAVYRAGIRQFRSNLRLLLDKYRRAGIPVFISTIASNVRDLPPFIGEPEGKTAQAAYRRQLDRADSDEASGDTTRALEILRGSVTEFPDAADPQYALARLLDSAGRYDSAAVHYRAARDRDRLPFRAPSAMNRVIRQEAAQSGVTLVDALGALRAASPHGIVGKSLILEHVHPNIEGQFLIANAFYNKLRHSSALPDTGHFVPEAVARRDVPVTVVDSMAGVFLTQRLTAGFPFQPRGRTVLVPVDTLTPHDTVQAIALAYLHSRLSWIDAQENLRHFYGEEGRIQDVLHVDRVVALEAPFPGPLLRAAMTARLAGDLDLTTRLASRARELGANPRALVLMAGVLDTRNDTAGARRLLDKARELAPEDVAIRTSIQAFNAIPQLEAKARAHPRDPEVLGNLDAVYYLTGQYDRAADLGRRVLKLNPKQKAALNVQRRIKELLTS